MGAGEQASAADADPVVRRPHFVSRLYDRDYDFLTHYREPACRYILASVPRSGSTLCSIRLWQSGQMGAPIEYLNFQMADRMLERLGYAPGKDGRPTDAAQLSRYWDTLRQLRTSPNGVFGCKLFVYNLTLLATLYPGFVRAIAPTHVIYLTRSDLVAQAISYYRAQSSQAWFAGVRPTESPEYDYPQIRSALMSICAQMAVWEKLFVAWGVRPLRLYYEQLWRFPRRVISSVEAHLGVVRDPAEHVAIPLVIRQADRESAEWRARFVSDTASCKAAQSAS